MTVNLKSRTTTATTKGWITLSFSCKGTATRRCRGNVFLDYLGSPVGRATFSLVPGKRTTVRVKLKPWAWKLVKNKKRLRVDVTITSSDGLGEVTIDSKGLIIVAPRPRPHR